MALLSLAVTLNLALTVVPHVTALSLIALFALSVNSGVTLNESLDTSAAVATAVCSSYISQPEFLSRHQRMFQQLKLLRQMLQ